MKKSTYRAASERLYREIEEAKLRTARSRGYKVASLRRKLTQLRMMYDKEFGG